MIAVLIRYFRAMATVKAELVTLRWYGILQVFSALHTLSPVVGEWFSRVSGLRARLECMFQAEAR